jgi:hypothetical protein
MSTSLGPIAAQRARNARMQLDAEQIAAQHAAAHGVDASVPVVMVPANTRTLVPLPDHAREAFLVHLRGVIAESFAQPLRDNLDAMSAQLASERDDAGETMSRDAALPAYMVLGGCSTCRGDCCTSGGTRAFLKPDSLVRVRAQRVTLGVHDERPEAIEALYVAALPAEHYEESCVFHARLGCTLRRELRSNLCNRYQCGELTQLRRALDASGAEMAYVASASGDALQRVALIRADAVDRISELGA